MAKITSELPLTLCAPLIFFSILYWMVGMGDATLYAIFVAVNLLYCLIVQVIVFIILFKKSLKIPKEQSEAVNRRTNNEMCHFQQYISNGGQFYLWMKPESTTELTTSSQVDNASPCSSTRFIRRSQISWSNDQTRFKVEKPCKKSLEISKGYSESVNRSRTDNTMTKRKSTKYTHKTKRSSNRNPTK